MTDDQARSGEPTGDRAENGGPPVGGEDAAMTREQLQLLAVPEAAEELRIGRNSAYELIKRGEFPHLRLGRRISVPRYGLARAIECGTVHS